MPYNGSGGFTIINTFVPGTTILSSAVNQNYSDLATAGLSNCLTKDGQQTWGANQKAGGFGITGMAAASAAGGSVEYAQWQTSAVPIGTILDYGGDPAPSKWLLCFGQGVSRTTYSQLFAAISTLWGAGDGVTTFNVPDLRGRVFAGKDNMGGIAAGRIGTLVTDSGTIVGTSINSSGGSQAHVQTGGELANHIHTGSGNVSDPGHTHSSTVVVGGGGGAQAEFGAQDGGGVSSNTATTNSNTTGITVPSLNISASGASGAMAWLQPTIIGNKIIFAGV